MTPKTLSLVWAASFLIAFLAGRIPNPLVGTDGFFLTNTAHDLVHLVTAIAFVGMAFRGTRAIRSFLLFFGVTYTLVGLAGFAVTGFDGEMGMLLGVVCINAMDNFLHLALGAGIFLTGKFLVSESPGDLPSPTAA